MFFAHDIFTTQALTDTPTITVQQHASGYARQQVCPADVLRVLLQNRDQSFLSLFTQAIDPESSIDDVLQILAIYHPARNERNTLPKKKLEFSPRLLVALAAFEAEWSHHATATQAKPLLLLAFCVLDHLETEDCEYLSIVHIPQCLALLRQQLQLPQAASVSQSSPADDP